jgi:hypothetical protein
MSVVSRKSVPLRRCFDVSANATAVLEAETKIVCTITIALQC